MFVAGCAGTGKHGVRASVRTETTTSTPAAAEIPSRLASPVTLNGHLHFVPPLAADTTTVTVAQVTRVIAPFESMGTPITGPIVFLARFTDDAGASSPAFAGDTGPRYPPADPNNHLVVAVLAYGPVFPSGGPTGMTGPPRAYNATTFWTYDPITGSAYIGGSFPGPLPQISTSPPTS